MKPSLCLATSRLSVSNNAKAFHSLIAVDYERKDISLNASRQFSLQPNMLGLNDTSSGKDEEKHEEVEEDGEEKKDPFARFPDNTNPETGEIGGPTGPEPTRYGDWERKGRVSDF